jgi:hypothetical protein
MSTGGYVTLDKNLASDPKVQAIVQALFMRYVIRDNDPESRGSPADIHADVRAVSLHPSVARPMLKNMVIGALYELWSYADEHIRDDNVLEVDSATLDAITGIPEFSLLLPSKWLRLSGERTSGGQWVVLPDFVEKTNLVSRRKRREKDRERKSNMRSGSGQDFPDPVRSDVRVDVRVDRMRHPNPNPNPKEEQEIHVERGLDLAGGAARSPIEQVFEHWKVVHNHPNAKLDAKRRRAIQNALKVYPVELLTKAIDGYKNSPHHMGQNDRKAVYDDVELFLRDAKHIDAGLKLAQVSPDARSAEPEPGTSATQFIDYRSGTKGR